MSGGGGTNTVTEKNSIPDWAGPFISYGAWTGDALGKQPLPIYQGQRTAELDPRQVQSLDMITQRALNGSPVLDSAKQQAQDTQAGKYLSMDGGTNPYTGQTNAYAGANPFLGQMLQANRNDAINAYNQTVRPQLDTAANRANAFGDNSGYREMQATNNYNLLKNLSNQDTAARMQDYTLQSQIANQDLTRNAQLADSQIGRGYQMYNNERQRQMQGLLFAPQLAQADYQDAGMLGVAGEQQRAFAQQKLNDAQQLWRDQAYEPYDRLQMYSNLTTPWWTGQSVNQKSSQYASNPYAQAAGLGMTGLGLYNAANTAGLFGSGAAAGTGAYTAAQLAAGAGGGYLYGTAAGLTAEEAAAMAAMFAA